MSPAARVTLLLFRSRLSQAFLGVCWQPLTLEMGACTCSENIVVILIIHVKVAIEDGAVVKIASMSTQIQYLHLLPTRLESSSPFLGPTLSL